MELGSGSGSSESSTVEQETPQMNDNDSDDQVVGGYEGCDESSELELGLALTLGGTGTASSNSKIPRIFTANDLLPSSTNNNKVAAAAAAAAPPPSSSSSSSCSSLGLRPSSKTPTKSNNTHNVSVGTKRAASPTALSQVVGWPPIRSYRMNSMANQVKSSATGEHDLQFDEVKAKNGLFAEDNKGNVCSNKDRVAHKTSMFVKVNMDGVAIGRKVDLTAHSSYESLALTLEEMFTSNAEKSNSEELILMPKVTRPSKLLDGTSDFVLTYEDKDGDWMLVGDVPWGMFVTSVKRLKIMRTSEANGLAPRTEDRSWKQKRRPI